MATRMGESSSEWRDPLDRSEVLLCDSRPVPRNDRDRSDRLPNVVATATLQVGGQKRNLRRAVLPFTRNSDAADHNRVESTIFNEDTCSVVDLWSINTGTQRPHGSRRDDDSPRLSYATSIRHHRVAEEEEEEEEA